MKTLTRHYKTLTVPPRPPVGLFPCHPPDRGAGTGSVSHVHNVHQQHGWWQQAEVGMGKVEHILRISLFPAVPRVSSFRSCTWPRGPAFDAGTKLGVIRFGSTELNVALGWYCCNMIGDEFLI